MEAGRISILIIGRLSVKVIVTMSDLPETHWHEMEEHELLNTLDTDPEAGLTGVEADGRRERFGPNQLTAQKSQGPLVRFLLQFHQALVYILLAAVVVTLWLGEWIDSSVIFAVVLINAIVGFLQEAKALKALEALVKVMRSTARVIRDGKTREMPASELVPGDIVLLHSGEKVPADLRLLRTHELRLDESALTGESLPVAKKSGVLAADTVLSDRYNMAYASTLVNYGQCKAVVVATGNQTEIGRISRLIAEAEQLQTPLIKKVSHFSGILLYLILTLAFVTFVIGALRGLPLADTLMSAVALAVAAIPEGLPAAFTIILAIGVARMTRRNAIIRKLPAVETLGSTTVICSDKTGTLTKNEMTVQQIIAGGGHYRVTGTGYVPTGEVVDTATGQPAQSNVALKEILLAGLLCNDAILVAEDGDWQVEGDPTEGALLVAARKAGLTEEHYLEAMPRVGGIPFESDYQYMATVHHTGEDTPNLIYLKGAAETILEKCSHMLTRHGTTAELDREMVMAEITTVAAGGMRVLAFARTERTAGITELSHQELNSDLTFLGFQAMIDPPRPEAIAAIAACHSAGIEVKMITGDHALTAAAIAGQMDLDGQGTQVAPLALSGKELAHLDDQRLAEEVNRIAVFARVTPEQKLRLVRALQSGDEVVAMTGDGVNDAPALKQADIGVAMGKGGTEVAKEAADIILTDDNFATIKAAVEEGRCVFDNLTKFIVWTLPTNMGEGLVVLSAIFSGVALPVLPVHILWINMSTALLLGLMLAFERKEHDIMTRPPRDPSEPILTRPLSFRILLVSVMMTIAAFALFGWELREGATTEAARTVAMNVIVFVELFYLLNCRSLNRSMFSMGLFSNRWLIGGIVAMVVLQLLITYLPLANRVFQTAPIGVYSWGRIVCAALLVYLVIGGLKWLERILRIAAVRPEENTAAGTNRESGQQG